MNYSDEPYVKVYKRRTISHRLIGWEGRAVLAELQVVIDRAGVLELEGEDVVDVVAAMTGIPIEVCRVGVTRLLERGFVEHGGDYLVVVDWIAQQTANQSDRRRQQDSRESRAAMARLEARRAGKPVDNPSVTNRDNVSRGVTTGHENGDSVTFGHEEKRREEKRRDQKEEPPNPLTPPPPSVVVPPAGPQAAKGSAAAASPRAPRPRRLEELEDFGELCREFKRNPHAAGFFPVQDRTEIVEPYRAWCLATKRAAGRLGGYDSDARVRAICELYGLGYTLAELLELIEFAPKDAWIMGEERNGDGRAKEITALTPQRASNLRDLAIKAREKAERRAKREAAEAARLQREHEAEKTRALDPPQKGVDLGALVARMAPPLTASPPPVTQVRRSDGRVTAEELDRALGLTGGDRA